MTISRAALETVFSSTLRTRRRCITQLHGEANAFACYIHFSHFDFDNIACLDHLTCVGDEFVAELTDVNQAILVDTQINKGAKGRHVAHSAFQNHAFLQIAYVIHTLIETCHLEIWAGVTSRFF